MKSFVSIIIVNWNGKKWLKGCFDSIYKQTYKNFEIILADNASTDDSISFVKKNYPKIKIIESKKNLGFSGGANLGYKIAKGDLILYLNNDTTFPKDFLEKFIKAFDEIPNLGIAQSKIRFMMDRDKLDSCGAFWTPTTFLYHYGNGKSQKNPKYNKSFQTFSIKGPSMFIKRELIEKIGLFDSAFWNYYEETDLCHRAWLAGYECWYYPKAEINHAMGSTAYVFFTNSYIQFHNFKNKMISFLKNFQGRTLLTVIPIFIFLNIIISIIWVLQGKYKNSISLYKALFWNVKNLRSTLKKRKRIQRLRQRSDREIFKIVRKNPRLSYYKYLFGDLADYKD